jgi:secreted PhoX family phosphatase
MLAKNNTSLMRKRCAAGKSVEHAGDSEFCGACFDPAGKYLFVNAQEPGISYAISGPWQRGPL